MNVVNARWHALLFLLMLGSASAQQVDKSLSAVDLFSGTSESIIRVETDLAVGTGFVVLLEGHPYIVTCKHVVEDPWADFLPVQPPGQPVAHYLRVGFQKDQLFDSLGYWTAKNFDLALMEVPASLRIKTLALRRTPVKPGETVYAIGFPAGMGKSITQGIVTSVYSDYLQFDAPISSGNSGGPLLDVHGEVVGIVTMGSGHENGDLVVQNLNFAIPAASVPLHRPQDAPRARVATPRATPTPTPVPSATPVATPYAETKHGPWENGAIIVSTTQKYLVLYHVLAGGIVVRDENKDLWWMPVRDLSQMRDPQFIPSKADFPVMITLEMLITKDPKSGEVRSSYSIVTLSQRIPLNGVFRLTGEK